MEKLLTEEEAKELIIKRNAMEQEHQAVSKARQELEQRFYIEWKNMNVFQCGSCKKHFQGDGNPESSLYNRRYENSEIEMDKVCNACITAKPLSIEIHAPTEAEVKDFDETHSGSGDWQTFKFDVETTMGKIEAKNDVIHLNDYKGRTIAQVEAIGTKLRIRFAQECWAKDGEYAFKICI